MFAVNNITLSEPNVLYIDAKPPKIVKTKKSAAARTKKPAKKKKLKRTIAKTSKIKPAKKVKIQQEHKIKNELRKDLEDKEDNPNDPLYTPEVELKVELNKEKLELEHEEIKLGKDDDNKGDTEDLPNIDKNYETEEQEEEVTDDDDEDADFDEKISDEDDEDEENDDEDEPLVLFSRSKGRPSEYRKKSKHKVRAPLAVKCRFSCKRRCNEKFTEKQRLRICSQYWKLSKEERLAYIRKFIKSKNMVRYKRLRAKNKRGYNCCYYLEDCIKNDVDTSEESSTNPGLIRVCRKYFEATLCVTNHYIKKALTGYQLEVDKDLQLLAETIKANKEKEKELSQEIKQMLDPETGNLIIIDPKDKTKKTLTSSAQSKPKKKQKRRRAGEPIRERFPLPIKCAIRCIYKCHTHFTEEERKQICDTFWSLDFKRRKDFVLANLEVKDIETQMAPEFRTSNRNPRTHQTRYFLRTGVQGENKRVCKHFLFNTLRISRDFISNAIEFADKTTGCYQGADRRGHHPCGRKHPEERKKVILEHISSYPSWAPNKKSKTKYLHHTLTIKKMYEDYRKMCEREGLKAVGSIYYYKCFHTSFRLMFLANPDPKKRGGCVNKNPTVSSFTGEEPGGFWLHPNREILNLKLFNTAQRINTFPAISSHGEEQKFSISIGSNSSQDSFSNIAKPSTSLQLNPLNYTTAAAAQHLANLMDPSLASTSSLNPRAISQTSMLRLDLNPNLYDNIPHANNITLSEPNVLYIDEKPPKIVKTKKSAAPRTKKPAKKKKLKRTIAKTKKIKPAKKAKIQQEHKIKNELRKDLEDKEDNPNDPLYTPEVEVKVELNKEKLELEHEEIKLGKDDDNKGDTEDLPNIDKNYETEEQDEEVTDDDDEDADFDGKISEEDDEDEEDKDDDEDEPLILLSRNKGRPSEYRKKSDHKVRAPLPVKCRFSCKRHCNEKFTEEQRLRICSQYWKLSKEERLAYIRKFIKSKNMVRYKRLRAKNKRGYNCCYYLEDCIKNDVDFSEESSTNPGLIRVCRKYFEATLCVTNHYIKKALTGYQLEVDKDLQLLAETIKANKEKEKELSQEIKQILDPETGNLIIIDPKDKTKKTLTSSAESKPKKKQKRRRAGEPIRERFPLPIKCAIRCIYKCHNHFTEEERKQICDTFWSLDFKRRKDFVLANLEVKDIETQMAPEFRTSNRNPRTHQTRYFLRTGVQGENKRVCKHFLINTLRISREFISNAIEFADKTTGCYQGADRRGHHPCGTKHPEERKKVILEHISSYPAWVPNKKSKTKYLHHTLTIKKMYEDYREMCEREGSKAVGSIYYYKCFHTSFRLMFLANPDPKKRGGCVNKNPTVSSFTGEEPGGFWLHPNGEILNLKLFNTAQRINTFPAMSSHGEEQKFSISIGSNSSQDSFSNIANPSTSLQLNPLNYTTAAAAQHLANLMDPSLASTSSLNPRAISQTSMLRLDLNPNLYDNLPHGSSSIFKMM